MAAVAAAYATVRFSCHQRHPGAPSARALARGKVVGVGEVWFDVKDPTEERKNQAVRSSSRSMRNFFVRYFLSTPSRTFRPGERSSSSLGGGSFSGAADPRAVIVSAKTECTSYARTSCSQAGHLPSHHTIYIPLADHALSSALLDPRKDLVLSGYVVPMSKQPMRERTVAPTGWVPFRTHGAAGSSTDTVDPVE